MQSGWRNSLVKPGQRLCNPQRRRHVTAPHTCTSMRLVRPMWASAHASAMHDLKLFQDMTPSLLAAAMSCRTGCEAEPHSMELMDDVLPRNQSAGLLR